MAEYSVLVSPRAQKDIDEIYAYIAMEKLAPENAEAQTSRLWDAIEKLDTFPEAHQDRIVGRYAGMGYKQLVIDNYIAIYRTDKTSKTVIVLTVQYCGRNQ